MREPYSSIPSFFEEDAYLFYNPDIASAVEADKVPSGYHHWIYAGHRELRAGAPFARAVSRRVFTREFENREYGVNLFGFLSTASGLGEVARSCRSALAQSRCPVREHEVPSWSNPHVRRTPPRREDRYRINLMVQNADMMPLFARGYGEDVLHGAYNIGFWFWELPSARADSFHHYDYVDEIWVASEFCRRSFSCLTDVPVVRMPVVVEGLEKLAVYGREHFGLPADAFLFGYIYDVNSYIERKNPLALIEAFRREFGDSREAMLVLKQTNGPSAAVDEAASGAANIRVLDRKFDDSEIASFHNVLDCFVSPHRSEGFGFNLAESMYLGKPVIATGYSGNADFMDERNSYPLRYRLIPIEETAGPYARGAVWADPDAGHLGALLRCVYEHREERMRRGAAAAACIRERFSSAEAGRRMEERFRSLGLDGRRVSRRLFSRHESRLAPPFVHPETPAAVLEEIRRWPRRPVVSVLADREDRVEAVRPQWYPYWEVCAAGCGEAYRGRDARIKVVEAGGLAAAAEISTGEYVAVLERPCGPEFLFEAMRALAVDGAESWRDGSGVVVSKRTYFADKSGSI